jgi:hypothetical protein
MFMKVFRKGCSVWSKAGFPLQAAYRTVPKRIKNVFKFQNFVNVEWLVLP